MLPMGLRSFHAPHKFLMDLEAVIVDFCNLPAGHRVRAAS